MSNEAQQDDLEVVDRPISASATAQLVVCTELIEIQVRLSTHLASLTDSPSDSGGKEPRRDKLSQCRYDLGGRLDWASLLFKLVFVCIPSTHIPTRGHVERFSSHIYLTDSIALINARELYAGAA